MAPRRRMHRQLIDMGEAVPVGTDHQMADRLIIQIRHENRAVRRVMKGAELFRIDAVALAVRHDRRHPPLLDRLADHGSAISGDFETEIAAPDIRRKAFIGDAHRQPWVFRIHDRLHTGKSPHSLTQSTVYCRPLPSSSCCNPCTSATKPGKLLSNVRANFK
ncbi:hypothetical protein D3C81_1098860 [compost metagenome]